MSRGVSASADAKIKMKKGGNAPTHLAPAGHFDAPLGNQKILLRGAAAFLCCEGAAAPCAWTAWHRGLEIIRPVAGVLFSCRSILDFGIGLLFWGLDSFGDRKNCKHQRRRAYD